MDIGLHVGWPKHAMGELCKPSHMGVDRLVLQAAVGDKIARLAKPAQGAPSCKSIAEEQPTRETMVPWAWRI